MEAPGHILLSRTDKIGDVILTLPMIPEIKRLLPESKISIFISNKLDNLLNGYEGIHNIFYYEDAADNLVNFFKSNDFDTIINVFPRKDIAVAAFRADVKTRVGTAYRFYSFLFNERIKEHRKYAVKHESEYNLNLLSFLNKEISYNKSFHLSYTESEYRDLKSKLSKLIDIDSKYIIIHPGSKGSAVDLPANKLIELAVYINTKYPHYRIVVTGLEQERHITSLFRQKLGDYIIDLTGKLGLREMMILIDKCDLFVSNSTGPIHIAGALNRKIIGFYPNSAPMNAVRWRPLSNQAVIISPQTGDDMTTITEMQVNKAADTQLNS
ncbi:MAG: glycosyltransferase family 9 protein [Candidatus Kapaibacterium sp.]